MKFKSCPECVDTEVEACKDLQIELKKHEKSMPSLGSCTAILWPATTMVNGKIFKTVNGKVSQIKTR